MFKIQGNHVSKCLYFYILKLNSAENLASSYTLWISQLIHIAKRAFGLLNDNLCSKGVIFKLHI